MRILVLEDDFLVAESLCALIEELGHEVVARNDNTAAAIQSAKELAPDLALLDIRVKGSATGIEAGRVINEELGIQVIYLTDLNSDEVFDMAKQTRPKDFLNKPVDLLRLKRSLELAEMNMRNSDNEDNISELDITSDRIFLKTKEGKDRVYWDDIYYLSADGVYCNVHLKDQKIILARPLGKVYEQFIKFGGRQYFLQIHRSTVVNKKHVERLKGNMLVVNGDELDISESYRDKVKTLFPSV